MQEYGVDLQYQVHETEAFSINNVPVLVHNSLCHTGFLNYGLNHLFYERPPEKLKLLF